MHYLTSPIWHDVIKPDQVLGPICNSCRLKLIRWLTEEADSARLL
jgi:hypothetical protein